jgi:sugar O-acyltransferase (sialic acid O-acetyltransferase NeuD family)
MDQRCVLYGVGTPYVYDVIESLLRLGAPPAALVANVPAEVAPRPVDAGEVIGVECFPSELLAAPVLIPLLTPGHRSRLLHESREVGFSLLATIVDPSATIASTATVGAGTHVNAGAVVAAMTRIGACCMVNRSASIGHHVVLEEFVTLGPGSVLCGQIHIRRGAFIGAGAVINPEVCVGENAVVGAGAVVVRDVPPHSIVVGNPAKVMREGIPGYNDVSV